MAEYESSGIWVVGQVGAFRHGMISHQELHLEAELSNRFDKWIYSYFGALPYQEFAEIALDIDAFNAEGRELARLLKAFVGPDVHVEYVPETKTGIGPSEVIQ
jgi:hypothetical protein